MLCWLKIVFIPFKKKNLIYSIKCWKRCEDNSKTRHVPKCEKGFYVLCLKISTHVSHTNLHKHLSDLKKCKLSAVKRFYLVSKICFSHYIPNIMDAKVNEIILAEIDCQEVEIGHQLASSSSHGWWHVKFQVEMHCRWLLLVLGSVISLPSLRSFIVQEKDVQPVVQYYLVIVHSIINSSASQVTCIHVNPIPTNQQFVCGFNRLAWCAIAFK